MFSFFPSTHAPRQRSSSRLVNTCSNFQTYPFTVNHGLYSFCMSLEQSEDRTIRFSTMSQILCKTIILEFLLVFIIKLGA